jgi:Ca-activated chloride channel family protein
VKIRGVIADVTVTQVYQNTGKKPLEAIYIFPMSTRAAVYAMTMKIEDRVLIAEIKEKQEARQIYEDAKNSGYTASLLEQHRPNVFQMNVANIMPGDSLIVELKYTELLIPEERVYEFVYPTVVGPRYSNTPVEESDGTEDYVETPYTHEGKAPSYKFDINVEILSGMAITELKSPSHELDVDRIEPDHIKIALKQGQENSGNKDYILRYSLASNQIKTGLLLSENGKEKFFLLMLQPPKRVEQRDITNREYIFVIDVSGSMYGFPLDVSKKMMRSLLSKLTPNDKFNVLLFAGGSSFMSCESMIATPENINNAMALIDRQQGGGGTELLSALNRVMGLPLSDGYSRIVTILTDGYVSVEPETYDLIRDNLDKASFFAFGIGSSVYRTIIEGIGTVGMGESFVITKPEEADQIADRYIKYIESPIMTDITLETEGFLAYDIIPKKIPDVMAERPILIFGKWMDSRAGGKITVKGVAGHQQLKVEVPIEKFMEPDTSQALKYLWARYQLKLLADYHGVSGLDTLRKQIIDIGLKYNLLTEFTSFVAVDYEMRNDGKELTTVKQPLPLPEEVSDYAVVATNTYICKASIYAPLGI